MAATIGKPTELETRFHRAMRNIYETAKREVGYNATRFRGMVEEHGGRETARRLLANPELQEGFATLWEANRLDLTVEALVLRPEYQELFSEQERLAAKGRLHSAGWTPLGT